MDIDKVKKLFSKGQELYYSGNYPEAKDKLSEAILYCDSDFIGLPEMRVVFASVLKKLGNTTERSEQLNLALNETLNLHKETSIEVTLAVQALVEHYLEIGEFNKGIAELEKYLKSEMEGAWILFYFACLLYHKLSMLSEYEEMCQNVLKYAPKGKYENLSALKSELFNHPLFI